MGATNSIIRILGPDDASVLAQVEPGVFDEPVSALWSAEFLADPRHHLAVALVGGRVVGMASGVHYVHPDKPPALFVNEVAVAPAFQRQGLGLALLRALLEEGRSLGCTEAWVGTERTNTAACNLYAAAGGLQDPEEFVTFTFPL